MVTLLSSKDPMSFQAISAMSSTSTDGDYIYDPTDAGEIERIAARNFRLGRINDDPADSERDSAFEDAFRETGFNIPE